MMHSWVWVRKWNVRRKLKKINFSLRFHRNDSRCGCNRLRREHSWDVINGNGSTWDQKKHTKPAVNNAYGLLDTNQAKYVRCDIETDPKNLVELMFSVWKMKKPRLLMCIIGGAKYFKLNERLEREFIKGIIQVALKAGLFFSSSDSPRAEQKFEIKLFLSRWLDHHQWLQDGCRSTRRWSDSRS